MDVNLAIALSNLLGVVFGVLVAGLYGQRSWRYWRAGECGLVQQLSLGIALVAGAWALHRGYYGFWRMAEYHPQVPAYPMDAAAEVTMLATALTVAGYGAHLYATRLRWMGYVALGAGIVIVAMTPWVR